jgi:predicted alpha/beta-fold hydrolase
MFDVVNRIETVDLSAARRTFNDKPFQPHRLFRSGHAQTIFAYLYPRRRRLTASFTADERRTFEIAPGVRLLAQCRWQAREKRLGSPTLLLAHGLEGSCDSIYMLGTADKAFAAGFNVVRLNLRTCGGTEKLTNTLYHSGMSGDLRAVIEELIERDKFKRIFLAGFSLGGNMSLKLAGEYGANKPEELRAVAAVSAPIDLAACADAIQKRGNFLYNRRFLNNLTARMQRISKIYPEIYNAEDIKTARSIREFDSLVTARYGGFADVDDYYRRSSALQFVEKIRVPTLMIHAEDDPFVPFEAYRHRSLKENPFVILLAPQHGGHVGFVSNSKTENPFWAENRIIEFFRLVSNSRNNN